MALLGEDDWRRFQRVLRHGKRALITGSLVGPVADFLLAPRAMTSVALAGWRRGHFSTANIATCVNRAIRDRLMAIGEQSGFEREIPERVTFGILGGN